MPKLSAISKTFPKIFLLAASYFLTGWLGLSIPFYGSYITLVWLPTGISVAALLLLGTRVWPGIALGAFLVNLLTGASVPLALSIAVSNTLAPLASCAWLRRSGFHQSLDHRGDMLSLSVAAGIGMTISSVWGVTSLVLAGVLPLSSVRSAGFSWWMGDTVGVLLGAPLLLTLTRPNLARLGRSRGELLAWILIAAPVCWFAFLQPQAHLGQALPFAFATLPLLAWASLRFGVTGAALASLVFSVLAAAGTGTARGSFFLPEATTSLLALWGYMAIVALTGLLITALLAERQAMEDGRRDTEAKLRGLFELSPLGIVLIDMDGRVVEFNESFRAIFGYSVAELKGLGFHALTPEASRDSVRESFRTLERDGQYGPIECNYLRKDGSLIPLQSNGIRITGADGRSYTWTIVEDIRHRRRIESDLRIAATAFEAQVSMFVTDVEGVILRVNKAFTEDSGFTAEDSIGCNPRIFKSGRHDRAFYADMWGSIITTGTWQGEIWDRRKTGEVYPKWMTISAVKSEDGLVTNYVATQFDITHRKAAEEEIRNLAFYDSLTRQPNRRLLRDRLQHAIITCSRSQKWGALLFIDLDHFKTLNDTLGHSQGDLLLQQVAQRLGALVREGDTVARFGGDEFVIMLEDLGSSMEDAGAQTETIAEKILAGLRKVYSLNGHDYSSTASIGVTLFGPSSEGIEELLKQADLAMYQAKSAGRNRLRFFDPKMQQAVTSHVLLEKNLRNAVREQQFVVHYQAQVNAHGRPTGAEVLVRWRHPERGLVYPNDFIPLAEETGLILPLGQWVLDVACNQLAQWVRRPEFHDLTLAVNVSGHQMRQADFVEQVLATLDRSGAHPGNLRLELTESILVANIDDTISKMSALSAHGVKFALDDFGTGYSSLTYLKRLPLHCLKIDRSFVQDILIDPNDAAIARTVIALAESLDLSVVAEGVETADQQEFLAENGCHEYQGYLYSRPIPLSQFEEYVLQVLVH